MLRGLNTKPNIIVFGDIMLDVNVDGSIEKLANEAPIPVFHKEKEIHLLGGCGNVSMNLHSLGCNNITVFSMIGNDNAGGIIKSLLDSSNIHHFMIESGKTTVKNRYFCNKKLMFRCDEESYLSLSIEQEDSIYQKFLELINTINIASVVFSDYNKGFLTPRLCQKIIIKSNEKGIFTCVDPKNDYEKYTNCTLIKPNRNEVRAMFGLTCTPDNMKNVLLSVQQKVKSDYVLITLADKGVSFLNRNNFVFFKTDPIEVVDVTGAGDIVNSIIAYYFPHTPNKEYIVQLSSYIATKSVSNVGTYVISPRDIMNTAKYFNNCKRIYHDDIEFIKTPVVFTNGCFDILHPGHLELFRFCKQQAISINGVCIVGINSDESVRGIKGNSRPINNLESRIRMLNSINDIDYIIVFDEDTPIKLLSALKPDVLVKGGDYTLDTIVGKEHCKSVKIFTSIYGYSTTNIIEKIKNNI